MKTLIIYDMLPSPDYPCWLVVVPDDELPEGIESIHNTIENVDILNPKQAALHELVSEAISDRESEHPWQGRWIPYLLTLEDSKAPLEVDLTEVTRIIRAAYHG